MYTKTIQLTEGDIKLVLKATTVKVHATNAQKDTIKVSLILIFRESAPSKEIPVSETVFYRKVEFVVRVQLDETVKNMVNRSEEYYQSTDIKSLFLFSPAILSDLQNGDRFKKLTD